MAQSNPKSNKKQEIQTLLQSFFDQHTTEQYKTYALRLLNRLERTKELDITRGQPQIWAASIVYVIARLNFLFDEDNSNHITHDTVCHFFQTKPSTTGNKATSIAEELDLDLGDEELSDPEIAKAFTFIQLDNGMIVPASFESELNWDAGSPSRETQEEREARNQQQRQQQEQEREEEKQKKLQEHQEFLF